MKFSITTTLVFLSLSSAAFPQSKLCIGGELDKLTSTQMSECKAKSVSLRQEARLVEPPQDWRFIVICDEAGWRDYLSFTGKHSRALLDATESTDRELGLTFVHASRIRSDDATSLDLVLASVRNLPAGDQFKQLEPAKQAPARSASMMARMNTPPQDAQ